jgi:hypothetical protein
MNAQTNGTVECAQNGSNPFQRWAAAPSRGAGDASAGKQLSILPRKQGGCGGSMIIRFRFYFLFSVRPGAVVGVFIDVESLRGEEDHGRTEQKSCGNLFHFSKTFSGGPELAPWSRSCSRTKSSSTNSWNSRGLQRGLTGLTSIAAPRTATEAQTALQTLLQNSTKFSQSGCGHRPQVSRSRAHALRPPPTVEPNFGCKMRLRRPLRASHVLMRRRGRAAARRRRRRKRRRRKRRRRRRRRKRRRRRRRRRRSRDMRCTR